MVKDAPTIDQILPDFFDFLGSRDAVDFAFGKGPERTKWPELKEKKKEESEISLDKLQNAQDDKVEIRKRIMSIDTRPYKINKNK